MDNAPVIGTFTFEVEVGDNLRRLFAEPECDLVLDGVIVGTNCRRIGDSVEFDWTPEGIAMMERRLSR